MTYEELMDKFRSNEVFIYGKSVVRITDMETITDSDGTKTNFVFQTDRNRRGVISVPHGESSPLSPEAVMLKKEALEKDIFDYVTDRVLRFRKETGAVPFSIRIKVSEVTPDESALRDFAVDGCRIDLEMPEKGDG